MWFPKVASIKKEKGEEGGGGGWRRKWSSTDLRITSLHVYRACLTVNVSHIKKILLRVWQNCGNVQGIEVKVESTGHQKRFRSVEKCL